MKKIRGGFTLTEALVVIACMVLLLAIFVPAVRFAVEDADRNRLAHNATHFYKSLVIHLFAVTNLPYDDFELPSTTGGGASVLSTTTRDYFVYLVSNGIIFEDTWSFYAAKNVPAAPGSYDYRNPGSASAFTSDNNAWRVVSDLTFDNVGSPFLITRNFQPDRLNASYGDSEDFRDQMSGPPYRDKALVVLFWGGNTQIMVDRALLWRNLNPDRLDNIVLPP